MLGISWCRSPNCRNDVRIRIAALLHFTNDRRETCRATSRAPRSMFSLIQCRHDRAKRRNLTEDGRLEAARSLLIRPRQPYVAQCCIHVTCAIGCGCETRVGQQLEMGALAAGKILGHAHRNDASLARPGQLQQARELLAPVYGWFTVPEKGQVNAFGAPCATWACGVLACLSCNGSRKTRLH
jgi:hypothetical protein